MIKNLSKDARTKLQTIGEVKTVDGTICKPDDTEIVCKGHVTENRQTSLNQDELFGFSPDLIRSSAVVAAKVVLGVRVNLRWIKSACINLRDLNQPIHYLYLPLAM